jgi:transcriptional regulator with XRE-family HTH domain
MKREITAIDFGQWIKEKRKAKGMLQGDLSRMIPLNKNTLSRYETGDRLPPLDIAERICEILGAELVVREHGQE